MPQPLSTREANLFRQVIRNYEDKQYKRGLKAAEQILKKTPKHGDTMAMKALILNAQGKTDEAFALGKEALTVDMKSHICWHVYGLLYRTHKNFEEAIKAYKFALRLEPESPQIQRDLAILQVQMRDYQGYVQSRHAMLQAKPQLRQSWTGLAIAHHLAGELQEAENILTTYQDTLKNAPSKTDLENAEAIMYRNMIIAETGDTQRALDHLESDAKDNLDRLAVMECRAKYLSKLGKKDEAVTAWRALLDRNPEHPQYYSDLITTLGIENDAKAKKAIFDEYADKYARCDAARRLPLDFLTGDEFREAARKYLTLMLNKAVPSTFANLKHLYSDSSKKETLPALAEEYLQSEDGKKEQGKAAALYFLAQHYNYHLSRDLAKAMEYCEKAIELEPKSVDFAMTKARIYKHHGNIKKASEAMDYARSLDIKDRYINSKAAKYQLRNNENEKALKTMGMFTRAETVGGPLVDLLDMQCVWFLTEDGEAFARKGETGRALKRFHQIWNIFDIWQEDQFDFHSFSLRKGLIRAYIDMIRWEDRLREHPFYSRAALDAVKLYVSMYDASGAGLANGVNGTAAEGGADDAAEKKKAAKKAKKEAQKAEREAAEKAAKQDPNKATAQKGKGDEPAAKKDDDPDGKKLAQTKDHLGDVMKFLSPLLQFSPRNIEAQLAGFEVFLRRKKYVLALACLNAAHALDAKQPKVHLDAVRLRSALDDETVNALPAHVKEVLKADFTLIDSGRDLKTVNAEFRKAHQGSAPHVLAAAQADRVIGVDKASCEKEAAETIKLEGITLEQALEVDEVLQGWKSSDLEAFQTAARNKWPTATVFSA